MSDDPRIDWSQGDWLAEVERLQAERDRLNKLLDEEAWGKTLIRAESAEADRKQLREALERIAVKAEKYVERPGAPSPTLTIERLGRQARSALSGDPT